MDEGFGTANVAEKSAVDDLVFAVGFLVFAAFEAFVGFFDNITGSFLHEEGLHAGGELVRVTDAVRGVIFVKEKELNGDIVLHLVDFVCPMEDVKITTRAFMRSGAYWSLCRCAGSIGIRLG